MSIKPTTRSVPAPRGLRIQKWKEFLDWTDIHSDSRWVFRGLGDRDFALLPSAGRGPDYQPVHEQAVFELFRKRVPEFAIDPEMPRLDLLAIAQHHGIPTRLLDWTSNPLVAAFFAVTASPGSKTMRRVTSSGRASPTDVVATPEAGDVTARVVAVRVRQNRVLRALEDPFSVADVSYFWPRAVASRITSQGGVFTVHPRPNEPWQEPLTNPARIFDIPGPMRRYFQRRLYYLGVHDHMIMGGLDGVGAKLRWQYTARTGLGAV